MTDRRRRYRAKSTSVSEICGLSRASLRHWDRQDENSVLNSTVERKGKVIGRAKFRFWIRGGICYTYVHPNSYRRAYRFLQPWQRKWGNYERRHQSDDTGLPVKSGGPVFVSLDRLQASGLQIADLRPAPDQDKLPVWVVQLARMQPEKFNRLLSLIVRSEVWKSRVFWNWQHPKSHRG